MAREAARTELVLLEVEPLVPIRNETVLTRYPIHRLGKHGDGISFEIREKSNAEPGKHIAIWQVSYNSKYGEPGPLAYKIDTLIVNRRIDEAREQGFVPELIKLGSLREIAREVGTGEANTSAVKQALLQNASVFLVTDLDYIDREGKKTPMKLASNRYAVILVGQALPDDRKADAVYIRLQVDYLALLNSARNRPLDYDYLKCLTPGPQRLYELLSFEIYAALKRQNGTRAKLVYSEYCTHAPQKRYFQGNRMRMQMKDLHTPHIASGYIADDVEYVETTDADGNADWEIRYTPGRKAVIEYVQFNTRGSRHIETPAAKEKIPARPAATQLALPAPEETVPPDPESDALAQELISNGLAPHRAHEAAREKEPEALRQALRHFQYKKGRGDKIRDAGALLADMIARPDKYVLPDDMPDPKKEAAKKEARRANRAAEETRIATIAQHLQELYAQMQAQQPEAFTAFQSHIEEEREKFMRTPIFKGRGAEIQKLLIASYDEDKGLVKHFLDYFRVNDCPLPELRALLKDAPEQDIKRALDALPAKK